jgi:septal ring factor EnvC (AmiA/AmiB activator)
MKKIAGVLVFSAFLYLGCVSKAKYSDALFQLEQSRISQSRIKQENDRLAAEIKSLENRNDYMRKAVRNFEERVSVLEKYISSSKKNKNKMITEMAVIRQNLSDRLNIKDIELESLREQNLKLINALESYGYGGKQSKKRNVPQ